jgi:hypothetical protein
MQVRLVDYRQYDSSVNINNETGKQKTTQVLYPVIRRVKKQRYMLHLLMDYLPLHQHSD